MFATHNITPLKQISYLFFSLILVFFVACSNQTARTNLDSEPLINEIFTVAEVENLNKIVAFFEGQICQIEGVQPGNVVNCYTNLFAHMAPQVTSGNLTLPYSLEEQRELYPQINKSLFNQIWYSPKGRGRQMVLSNRGKYSKLLEKMSLNNLTVAKYLQTMKNTGDLSPGMVAEMLINHKNFDVNDPKIRLLTAIHYLTWNEQLHAPKIPRPKSK